MIDLAKYRMGTTGDISEISLKTKISFSVESLLSNNNNNNKKEEEEKDVLDRITNSPDASSSQLDVEDMVDEEDEEDITVDDDDDEVASRESLSPNSSHPVLIPQPVHATMPRLMPQAHPQWLHWGSPPPGLLRSGSPQSKFHKISLDKIARFTANYTK